jgi:hypothetical protein
MSKCGKVSSLAEGAKIRIPKALLFNVFSHFEKSMPKHRLGLYKVCLDVPINICEGKGEAP